MSTSDTAPARILVVEDEKALAGIVEAYLVKGGFVVDLARNGRDAVALARDLEPDVIVLDLGLPGLDGIEVCRQVRTFSTCYIVIVSARTEELDTLVGLSVGADDYLTKPFSPRELLARVQAMLRRPRTVAAANALGEQPARRFGALHIDATGRDVQLGERPVALTRTEFDILDVLSARPKVAFSRRQILDQVWDPGWVGDDHVIDVHVAHIRRKLDDDPSDPRYVLTVRGVGYRMGPG